MLAAADRGLINIVKDSIQKKANVNYQDGSIFVVEVCATNY